MLREKHYLIILFILSFSLLPYLLNSQNSLNEKGYSKLLSNKINPDRESNTKDSVVFFENFDHGGEPPPGWTQEVISGSELWLFMQGNGSGHPPYAHSGSTNTCLYDTWGDWGAGHVNRLISPPIEFGNYTSQPDLTFWLCQESWGSYQDRVSIEYRTSEDDQWHQIGLETNNHSSWYHLDYLPFLPNPSNAYQISFVGYLEGGYGICIDDVQITGIDNGLPGTPSDPEPDNQSSGVSTTIDLSWINGGNTDSVKVYFDTVNPPLNCVYDGPIIGSLTNIEIGGPLNNLTTYYWQVEAKRNSHSAESNIWNFTTQYPSCPGFPINEDFNLGFNNFANPFNENDTDWIMHDSLFTSGDSAAWNPYNANDNNILVQTCTMDLTTRINTYLKFKHIAKTQTNQDSCLVEISTDAGYSWNKLPSNTYMGVSSDYSTNKCFWESSYKDWGTGNEVPNNNFWREEIFDLSSFNYADAAVLRFRLKANGSTQKYGWLIDDIEVTELISYPDFEISDLSLSNTLDTTSTDSEILTISNAGDTDLLYTAAVNYTESRSAFYEDFESGEFPPSGWNEYILGSSGTGWRETTYWSHSPSHSAYHNDDNVSSISKDWLVTPMISTSIGDTLYFWEKNKYVSGYYYYHGVWLSTGSPNPADGDFIELQEYSSTASSWKLRKIDLSDYALQDIYIGFKYMGDYDTEWYIDDVGIIPGLAQWLTIDGGISTEDIVLTGESDEINVGYDATELDIGSYTAEIIFNHNAAGSPDTVNVYLTVVEQILQAPENINVIIQNDSIHISWNPVAGADFYRVYSSDKPFNDFSEDTSGSFDYENWYAPINENKLFYYIKAISGTKH